MEIRPAYLKREGGEGLREMVMGRGSNNKAKYLRVSSPLILARTGEEAWYELQVSSTSPPMQDLIVPDTPKRKQLLFEAIPGTFMLCLPSLS